MVLFFMHRCNVQLQKDSNILMVEMRANDAKALEPPLGACLVKFFQWRHSLTKFNLHPTPRLPFMIETIQPKENVAISGKIPLLAQ